MQATELALLPETSEEAGLYHAEILRRQDQNVLDASTAQLASEKRRFSTWTVIMLAIAMLATTATMLLQK